MDQHMKKVIHNYALINAVIGVLYTTISYVTGNTKMFTTWWIGILIAIVGIAIVAMGAQKYRNVQGGFMSFREAFTVSFMIFFISGVISILFNMLIFNVIDPGYAEQLDQAILEMTVSQMEKFGTPESAIAETMEKMEAQGSKFGVGNQIKGFGFSLIFYAILSLIIAAFTRKKAPEFTNTDAGSGEN